MPMPTGVLLTAAALSPALIGSIIAACLLFARWEWQVCFTFFLLQLLLALNDIRVACLTIVPGYWYVDKGNAFSNFSILILKTTPNRSRG
jgi:hypothetical protein